MTSESASIIRIWPLHLAVLRVARVVAPKKEKLKEANAELAVAMKVSGWTLLHLTNSLFLSLSFSSL